MTDTEMLDWWEKYGLSVTRSLDDVLVIFWEGKDRRSIVTNGGCFRDAIRAAVAEQKGQTNE